MSATLQQPKTLRFPASRRRRLAGGFGAVVAAAGAAVAIGLTGVYNVTREDEPSPARAFPGALTTAERAAVAAALTSPDPRRQRIARQVAAGQAGASALADPQILHHHGVDTSRIAVRDNELAAQRFHHR
jgi:hypothetical protein